MLSALPNPLALCGATQSHQDIAVSFCVRPTRFTIKSRCRRSFCTLLSALSAFSALDLTLFEACQPYVLPYRTAAEGWGTWHVLRIESPGGPQRPFRGGRVH